MTRVGEAARDPREELMECRNAIEVVDRRIVALLAQRVALGLRAATAKRDAGLPLIDLERETEVMANVVAAAHEQGLPVDAMRDVFQRVVAMSRRAQEEAR